MRRNFLDHLHSSRVSRFALRPMTTCGLGVACLGCLAILFATGMTLFLYYVPDQEKAYERILHITTTLHYGGPIRTLHYLAANSLIILAILHLVRVVLTGSYCQRWLNWLFGLVLLALLLFANFTGYLLPWDQVSFWAIKVGASLADYIPLLGSGMKDFLLGGDAVGHETLLRCFALHAGILPPLLLGMTALHLWRIRKDDGLAAPPGAKTEQLPAAPWLYRAEAAVVLSLWALLVTLSFWIQAPVFERADPTHPPNPAKAPWFFVGLQEMVGYSAFWGGVVLPALLGMFLLFLPQLDRSGSSGGIWLARDRRGWIALFLALLASQLLFICLGQFCRGKDWQLIWPF
jgi:quinol-cytochrome oxidoreductase complex cytochrome b subunit